MPNGKSHYLSEDFLERWEHIINDIEKTNVPIECIDRIVVKLFGTIGPKQKTINVNKLKANGLSLDEIEVVISSILYDLQDDIRNVEFFLDLGAVADIIQPETDHFLKNM